MARAVMDKVEHCPGRMPSFRHHAATSVRCSRCWVVLKLWLPCFAGVSEHSNKYWMSVPRYCSLNPGMVADTASVIKLAEALTRPATRLRSQKQEAARPSVVRLALYRAGQFEEAARRLEEAIQISNKSEDPFNWAFLAMAHGRGGHYDEARHSARPSLQASTNRRSRPVLGRVRDPPAPQRSRGGDPLRPSIPGRSIRSLNGGPSPECRQRSIGSEPLKDRCAYLGHSLSDLWITGSLGLACYS